MKTKRFIIRATGRIVNIEFESISVNKKKFDVVNGLSLSYLDADSLEKVKALLPGVEANAAKAKIGSLMDSEGQEIVIGENDYIVEPKDCFKQLVRTIQSTLPAYIELDKRVALLIKLLNSLHPISQGSREKVNILSGCHVLFGTAGSGKTTMMREISKKADVKGHPCLMIVTGEPSGTSTRFDMGLLGLISSLCAFEDTIILFDSLRHLLYAQSGSTLAGGVSSSLLDMVTTLSVIGEYTGNALCVAVNPLASNDEKYTLLLEALRGSATSVVNLSPGGDEGSNNSFETAQVSSRRSENREFVSITRSQIADMLTDVAIVVNEKDSEAASSIFSDAGKYESNVVNGSGRQGLVALNGSDLVDRDLGELRKLYMPMFS